MRLRWVSRIVLGVVLASAAFGCVRRLDRDSTQVPTVRLRAPDASAFVAVWMLDVLARRLDPPTEAIGAYLLEPDSGWLRTIRGTPYTEACAARHFPPMQVCEEEHQESLVARA